MPSILMSLRYMSSCGFDLLLTQFLWNHLCVGAHHWNRPSFWIKHLRYCRPIRALAAQFPVASFCSSTVWTQCAQSTAFCPSSGVSLKSMLTAIVWSGIRSGYCRSNGSTSISSLRLLNQRVLRDTSAKPGWHLSSEPSPCQQSMKNLRKPKRGSSWVWFLQELDEQESLRTTAHPIRSDFKAILLIESLKLLIRGHKTNQ